MAKLALIRHGESIWNKKGLWTGFVDVDLDSTGVEQAKEAAVSIKDIPFNIAFCSVLKRAIHTLNVILDTLGYTIPVYYSDSLNERNYGIYTGKNKWEIEKEVGEEKFEAIRRAWNEPIPNGESLQEVYQRVSSYYTNTILPYLQKGENVIVSFHGNSMRALIKHIEKILDDQVQSIEVATGEVFVYDINLKGEVTHKEIRATHKNTV